MEAIRFIIHYYYLFYIIALVFLVMLLGYYADIKLPKKEKGAISEQEEMERELFNLKNNPLAKTKNVNEKASNTTMKEPEKKSSMIDKEKNDNKKLSKTPIVMEDDIKENFKG